MLLVPIGIGPNDKYLHNHDFGPKVVQSAMPASSAMVGCGAGAGHVSLSAAPYTTVGGGGEREGGTERGGGGPEDGAADSVHKQADSD